MKEVSRPLLSYIVFDRTVLKAAKAIELCIYTNLENKVNNHS